MEENHLLHNPNLELKASNTPGMGMKIPSIRMRTHQMWNIELCHEFIMLLQWLLLDNFLCKPHPSIIGGNGLL